MSCVDDASVAAHPRRSTLWGAVSQGKYAEAIEQRNRDAI